MRLELLKEPDSGGKADAGSSDLLISEECGRRMQDNPGKDKDTDPPHDLRSAMQNRNNKENASGAFPISDALLPSRFRRTENNPNVKRAHFPHSAEDLLLNCICSLFQCHHSSLQSLVLFF